MMLTAVVGLASPLGHAAISANDAIAGCEAEARAKYSQGTDTVRVKFKGMYGNPAHPRIRLQVLPDAGKAFLSVCEADGNGDEMVSLMPRATRIQALETIAR
jgi:hypothetical protein